MVLGILNEAPDNRVALVPQVAKKVNELGIEICIETGAGASAGFPDSAYADVAAVKSRDDILRHADLIVAINQPDEKLLEDIPSGKYVISSFAPYMDDSIVETLRARGLKAFSMDMIPRTTLAQSMDVLSSMASIAGYRAAILAAENLVKYFPMMITAAGSIKPAKVLVIGAGVAGLQAIATAKRLGAMVEAFDTRNAAKQEVESLGAKFVEVEGARDDKDAGGYAVEQTEEYMKRQRELVEQKAADADVVITTAQVRGRKAPVIIPAETVDKMRPGTVIVDLAASTGGNCALTRDNEVFEHNGVRIIGDSDLAAGMPGDASFLFGNNVFNFIKHMMDEEGNFTPDPEDEIVKSAFITL